MAVSFMGFRDVFLKTFANLLLHLLNVRFSFILGFCLQSQGSKYQKWLPEVNVFVYCKFISYKCYLV